MHDVNWWLMVLAFLLGLLLTFAMMIRRVTREVPVTHTVSAGIRAPHVKEAAAAATATAAAAGAALHGAAEKVEKHVDAVEKRVEKHVDAVGKHVEKHVDAVEKHVEHAEKKVHTAVQNLRGEDILEAAPYGSGSIRVTSRKVGPAGYTIKGDKDTGRFFTADSPEYDSIEAEVWFANEESAQKAGFLRWDAKGDQKAAFAAVGADAVITEQHASADIVIKENHDADATLVVVDEAEAPYGKGSARAAVGGVGPSGWLIKGNEDSMLYHGTDSPAYEQTIAEVWFVDEATAEAAGFRRWDINFK